MGKGGLVGEKGQDQSKSSCKAKIRREPWSRKSVLVSRLGVGKLRGGSVPGADRMYCSKKESCEALEAYTVAHSGPRREWAAGWNGLLLLLVSLRLSHRLCCNKIEENEDEEMFVLFLFRVLFSCFFIWLK